MKKLGVLIIIITTIYSCGVKKSTQKSNSSAKVSAPPAPPTPPPAPPAPPAPPVPPAVPNGALAKTSAKELLAQGQSLYETKCNTCHAFKHPKSKSEEGWHKLVPEMANMSNEGGKPISQQEQDLILAYLLNVIKE